MRHLKAMAENDTMAQELERLSKVYQGLKSSIEYLENDSVPASNIWLNLRAIEELLKCCGLDSQKLSLYFDNKHPALQFWKDVQFLDPRKAGDFFQTDNVPASLLKFADHPIPVLEVLKYKVIVQNGTFPTTINASFDFWKKHRAELPELSKLALTALNVPGSSASVERSFSVLKRVFSNLRTNLTDENLEIHLKIAFNQRQLEPDYDTFYDFDSD